MRDGEHPGPDARVVRSALDGGAMLYDACTVTDPAVLFDRAGWQAHGITASAAEGGRGAVTYLDTGSRRLVLRRYLRGGLPAAVSRDRYLFLGEDRTRPFREFRLLVVLLARRLPVPQPVAARYLRRGLLYGGELVTERLPGAVPLGWRWLEGAMTDADWETAGRCIRRFHDAGVQHPDLNANNVMLDGYGGAWLLDFDRGRIRTPGPWREKVLERLARSLAKMAAASGQGDAWQSGFARLRAAHDAAPPG